MIRSWLKAVYFRLTTHPVRPRLRGRRTSYSALPAMGETLEQRVLLSFTLEPTQALSDLVIQQPLEAGIGIGQPDQPNAPGTDTSIEGINFDENATNAGFYSIPPDPIGAAGPNHVVSVVNTSIEWHTMAGVQQNSQRLGRDSTTAVGSFFETLLPVNGTFDPKVIYDKFSNRFIVLTLERTDDNDGSTTGDAADTSRILVAVSDDSDPNGTWSYLAINSKTSIGGKDHWADYPGFAVDEEAIYITNNMFGFGNSGGFGVRLWIIDKGAASGFYAGGAASFTVHDPYAGGGSATTTQPAYMYAAGPSTTGTFLVSYSGLSNDTAGDSSQAEFVQVVRVDNPLTAPTFSQQFINVGNIEHAFPGLPDAPQLDDGDSSNPPPIETNDRRAMNAVWRNNQLWTTAEVLPSSGADSGQTTAHWWNLNTTTLNLIAVNDQGNVGGEDIAVGAYTFMPSIAVDAQGNMGMGFSVSAPTIYASAAYTGRFAGDTAGTVQPAVVYAAGLDEYVRAFGGSRNRWGDYSGITVDPSNDLTFWVFNVYAISEGTNLGNTFLGHAEDGRWGTRWGEFTLAVDYGDAPNTHLTTFASDGARHIATGVRLGSTRDSETDAGTPLNGTGDDATNTGSADDEDGVTIPALTQSVQATFSIDVQNLTGGSRELAVWIDSNQDGVFAHTGERVLQQTVNANGTVNFNFTPGFTGNAYMRVRISTDTNLTPSGQASDGEVEDYLLTITGNSPPVAQASSVTTDEDTAKTFAVSDFQFTDGQSNGLVSITVSGLALAVDDTLTVDLGSGAVAVTNAMTITAAQIATLIYTPKSNANGAARSTFNFKVNDADLGTVAATMSIHVTAINDNPVLNNQSLPALAENSANVTVVGTVAASDPEAGQTLTYAITGGNTGGAFEINIANGQVTVANVAALDFETNPIFNLTVQVTDNGTPNLSTSATVTVNLLNQFEVTSSALQSIVPLYQYPLSAPDTLNDWWQRISDAATADRPVTVIVNPNSGPFDPNLGGSDYANYLVGLSLLRSNPNVRILGYVATGFGATSPATILQHAGWYASGYKHNTTGASLIDGIFLDEMSTNVADVVGYTVVASGIRALDGLAGHFIVGNPGTTIPEDYLIAGTADLFIIREGTLADLLANATPSYVTAPAFDNLSFGAIVHSVSGVGDLADSLRQFKLRGLDYGFVTDDTAPNEYDQAPTFFEAYLRDIHAPYVVQSNETSLPENSANSSAVFSVSAGDPDPGQTLTYAITGGNTGGAFAINDLNGQITVANSAELNFEVTPTFALTVQVTDNGTPLLSDTATVTVNLTNVNELPVAQASSVTTDEDIAKTFAVSDFLFNDVEGNSLVSITISGLTLAIGDMLTVDQGSGAVDVTNGMTITAAQIASLIYTPAENTNGAALSTFDIRVNDSDLGTVAATMSIHVTAVNDAPEVGAFDTTVTYTANGAAALLDQNTTVTDVDTTRFNTGVLTVSLTANAEANDRLSFRPVLRLLGVSGSNLTYRGTTVASFTGGTGLTNLVITFNGNATVSAVQTVLRNLTYRSVSSNPSTAARTVQVTLTDGTGTTSNLPTKTINVTAVPIPPINSAPTAPPVAENPPSVTTLSPSNTNDSEYSLSFANTPITQAANTGNDQNREYLLSFANADDSGRLKKRRRGR